MEKRRNFRQAKRTGHSLSRWIHKEKAISVSPPSILNRKDKGRNDGLKTDPASVPPPLLPRRPGVNKPRVQNGVSPEGGGGEGFLIEQKERLSGEIEGGEGEERT